MSKFEKYFYWFCLALAIYITIGFKAIPAILHDQIIKNLDKHLTQNSTIEKIEFNPFTLNTRIHNYTLGDIKNPTVKFEQFQLDLGLLQSIFELHANIEQVSLIKPFINIVEEKDGSINLAKLLKPSSKTEEKTKEESTSNVKFLVSKIFLKDANINFSKINEGEPYKLSFKNINYNLYDLGTYKNSLASSNFKLDINNNTKVSIEGGFNLAPFKMYGNAYIQDLMLEEFLTYKKDILNFELDKNAKFNTNIDFDIDSSKQFDLKFTTNQFEFANINLKQNQKNIVKLEKLSVNKLGFDLINQKVELNAINFDKPAIKMIQSKDGLNLANLTTLPKEKKLEAKVVQKKEQREKEKTKPWNVLLSDINLNTTNFSFEDKLNNMIAKNENFNVKVSNVNLKGSDIAVNSIKVNNPALVFKDNKNRLSVLGSQINTSIANILVKANKTTIKDVNVSKKSLTIDDKKSAMKIATKNSKVSLENVDINGSNMTLSDLNTKVPYLNMYNRKTGLNITSNNADVNLKTLSLKDKKTAIDSISLLVSSLKVKERKAKLDISTKNTKVNVSNINVDGSTTSIAKVKLRNPKLDFKDNKSKLFVKAANTAVNVSTIKIANNKTTVSKIDLINPSLNLQAKKSNTDVTSKNLKVYLSGFSQNKYGINLNKIRVIEPSLNVYNTKDKTKIVAKNLDLKVNRLSNSTKSGLKAKNASLNNPSIAITLAKKPKVKEEKKAKKEEKLKEENTLVKKEPKPTDLKINIGPIAINNATLNFEDKNLPISFKTKISELNGKVSGINTKTDSSNLEVNGVVDKYGSTKITGTVSPNNIKILTDINMIFKNIAMTNFTPYTGKFIGREIDSGKLDLNLKYNIESADLDANNNIVITKIKFGKNVESEDAVSLPLELAIALLEDSNGIIDLNIPVSGNIDDPKFSVAPIVWKAFTNLILKAITAPFSLLGAIFGFSEDEIKSVNFDYGQSNIGPSQKETLDKISQILSKRPNLALELTASYEKDKDLLALKKAKYDRILEKKLPNKGTKYYNAEHLDLIEFLYIKKKRKLTSLKKRHTINKKLDLKSYILEIENFLINSQNVSKAELEKMAKDRIENMKAYLIEEKLVNTNQIHKLDNIDVKTTTFKTSNIDLKISKAK